MNRMENMYFSGDDDYEQNIFRTWTSLSLSLNSLNFSLTLSLWIFWKREILAEEKRESEKEKKRGSESDVLCEPVVVVYKVN